MAIELVRTFSKKTSGNITDVLILRYENNLKMDNLELAIQSHCRIFVSDRIIQSILDEVWLGTKLECEKLVIT